MKLRRRHPSPEAVRRAGNCPNCLATGQQPLGAPLYFRLVPCATCNGTGRG